MSEGIAYAAIGLMMAAYLSPGPGVGALSVALASLGLYPRVLKLFARHRDQCWAPGANPNAASLELIFSMTSIFIGVFIAYAIFASSQNAVDIPRVFSFQFHSAFMFRVVQPGATVLHQFALAVGSGIVMVLCSMLLTAVFKEGGVSLLISWVGSLWGVGLLSIIRSGEWTPDGTMLTFFLSSIGFLTAGATGLFLSRGAEKYDLASPAYHSIVRSSLLLIGSSLGLIILSSLLAAVLARGH